MLTLPDLGLKAYAYPVVVSVLEEMDYLPFEIEKLGNEKQMGPLIVTMASELTVEVVQFLYSDRRGKEISRERRKFLEIHLGNEFQEKLRRLDEETKARESQLRLLNRFKDRELSSCYVVSDNPDANLSLPNKISEGWLRFSNLQIKVKAEEVEAVREKLLYYGEQFKRFSSISKRVHDIEESLSVDIGLIEEIPKLQSEFNVYLRSQGIDQDAAKWNPVNKRISIDFDIPSFLLGDAARILSETDSQWWRQFVIRTTKKVNAVGKKGFWRIIMRIPEIVEAVQRVLKISRNRLEEDVWVEVLQQVDYTRPWPAYYGRGEGLCGVDIRGKLRELREEDAERRQWIHQQGGMVHPSDYFSSNRGYPNVLPSYKRKILKDYCTAQATNELYWCLSRKFPEYFRPFLHSTYPIEKWEEWVKTSSNGLPNYWERK